jgi:hypothetical protein
MDNDMGGAVDVDGHAHVEEEERRRIPRRRE